MAVKEFNALDFKKSVDKIAIIFIIIGLIGIVSIICAFTVGDGLTVGDILLGNSFGNDATDPCDYYDSYHSFVNGYFMTVEFHDNHTCTVVMENGMLGSSEMMDYRYEYVSSSYAYEKVPAAEEGYDDFEAIIIYTNDNQVILLWITSTDPYTFIMNSTDAEFTTEELNRNEHFGDPKDYMCTYTYNENTYITFHESGLASFSLNGNVESYYYMFVDSEWIDINTNYSCERGIIVYEYGSTSFYMFEYVSNKKLVYDPGSSDLSFTGSGSAPPADYDPDNGNNGNSGNDELIAYETQAENISAALSDHGYECYFEFGSDYGIPGNVIVISSESFMFLIFETESAAYDYYNAVRDVTGQYFSYFGYESNLVYLSEDYTATEIAKASLNY